MKYTRRLSYLYAGLAIPIVRLIDGFTLGRRPGGADCSDLTWQNVPTADVIAFYHSSRVGIVIASSVMIIIGVILLVLLLREAVQTKKSVVLAAILVLLVIAGYCLLALTALSLRYPC